MSLVHEIYNYATLQGQLMEFTFVEVQDQTLLEKVFKFRYEVSCEEKHIFDAHDYPAGLERDCYDDFSDQFAVLDGFGDVCATVRLVHHSKIGYPMEEYLEFDKSEHGFESERLAELSRIFIHAKYRNMRDTKRIIQGLIETMIYDRIKGYGISYCYGTLEQSFIKLLNIFRIPYVAIGEGQLRYGAMRYPCIMHTDALEAKNPGLYEHPRKLR